MPNSAGSRPTCRAANVNDGDEVHTNWFMHMPTSVVTTATTRIVGTHP